MPQPRHGVIGCVGVQILAPCFGDCQGASTYITSVKLQVNDEDRKLVRMMLDPLGHDPVKDIDEIHNRNRRKTDSIKAPESGLSPREEMVLRIRSGLVDAKDCDLGPVLDFDATRDRIRQIEAKAIQRLKHPAILSRFHKACE